MSGTFVDVVLPHLDSAHRLARWLTRNNDDAADIVQEATLRAFRHFDGFRGGDARAWLLTIVRNTGYRWQRNRNRLQYMGSVWEWMPEDTGSPADLDPEQLILQRAEQTQVTRTLNGLPARCREVLVMRELDGLSYREIADATGVPIGTVMSRLARARSRFRRASTFQPGPAPARQRSDHQAASAISSSHTIVAP